MEFTSSTNFKIYPDAIPTVVSYNASTIKIYNATSSLVRFENKKVFFHFERNNALAYYNAALIKNAFKISIKTNFKIFLSLLHKRPPCVSLMKESKHDRLL
jgi:hypothetical protein